VFLAVAITALASRADEIVEKHSATAPEFAEIVLFCIFYTLLRIKWYLDDIRIKGLVLPPEDEIKEYRRIIP